MTPHLECPHCLRTSWILGDPEREVVCGGCGSALAPSPDGVLPGLAAAVRERFDRDARLDEDRPRFVREPR